MIGALLRRHRAVIRPATPERQIELLAGENARLRQLVADLRADLRRATRPVSDVDVSGLPRRLLVASDLVLRAELARRTAACQKLEDRLAVYERRPSPVYCPRSCCSGGVR